MATAALVINTVGIPRNNVPTECGNHTQILSMYKTQRAAMYPFSTYDSFPDVHTYSLGMFETVVPRGF